MTITGLELIKTFRLWHWALPLLAAAALGGCGDDNLPDGIMAVGVEYEVSSNDRLVSTSAEPAEISVRHDTTTDRKYITLLSGTADLLRGSYQSSRSL